MSVKKAHVKDLNAHILYSKTQKIINKLEGKLDGPIVNYWISPNGSLCHNDVIVFNEVLNRIGNVEKLYLFIKSDGGQGRASLRMINLLRGHCKSLRALVPLNCESAATMLALGADEIHMGPMAFLTPVDTSIRHDLSPVDKDNDLVSIGTNELERIAKLWKKESPESSEVIYKTLYQYIHPLAIAAVDRAGSLSNMLCDEIMSYHIKDAKVRKKISDLLNSHYPSHGYPIVLREAMRIGINAKELDVEINKYLIELNGVYSEIGQRRRTDFTENHYHNGEVLNVIECRGLMAYYQVDKEWHYRETERNWVATNEKSSYRTRQLSPNGEEVDDVFHVR